MKDKLKSFFTEYWRYIAVSSACKLNLFDHLQEAKTAQQLANDLSLNAEKLSLLLSALHDMAFLDKNGDFFKVNACSEHLTEENPESLKYACTIWSDEHLIAWQNLDFAIRTGKSSFEEIYKKPFFEFLNEHPEKLYAYHKAMYQYAKDDYKNLPDVVHLKKHDSIMDVGGGYGAIVEIIKTKHPAIECILFDLPTVVEKVSIPNIKKIGGNFFEKISKQSEAIILARILHDWNDEKASLILKNCFEALPKHGALYVIENCADKVDIDLSLLSLNMTALCGSYERTSHEYISLCRSAGFYFESDAKLNALQSVLTFKKI